jgi:uroporphyrinogen-III synthase
MTRRPRSPIASRRHLLHAAGAMALAVPLLRIGPAADEQGVKRFTAGGWIAFVAPAGFTTGALPPERFTEQLRRELAIVGKAGREAKIVME